MSDDRMWGFSGPPPSPEEVDAAIAASVLQAEEAISRTESVRVTMRDLTDVIIGINDDIAAFIQSGGELGQVDAQAIASVAQQVKDAVYEFKSLPDDMKVGRVRQQFDDMMGRANETNLYLNLLSLAPMISQ